jgi:hypothetical protein
MYVLTEGWYDMCTVKGVVATEAEAREWELGDYNERDYYGPFEPGIPKA